VQNLKVLPIALSAPLLNVIGGISAIGGKKMAIIFS